MMGEPAWDGGEPVNLEAAAADALEWLLLIERAADRGVWRFSQPDSRGKLRSCRMALQEQLRASSAAQTSDENRA